jgi:signal peptidase II
MRGHVVDFIQLPYFAIVNVADICLTSAAVTMVIVSLISERPKSDVSAASEAPEESGPSQA